MKIFQLLVITGIALSIFSCSCMRKTEKQTVKETTEVSNDQTIPAEPPLVVYKTKADYSKQVPVLLSCDKTHIISYPHPGDLKKGNEFRYPTLLPNGYFLDNKGITKDVAFLEYTYEEYAAFTALPTADSLFWKILDKDPLTEFCMCGSRLKFDGNIQQLSDKIDNGDCDCK